jgi:hypothetical protein
LRWRSSDNYQQTVQQTLGENSETVERRNLNVNGKSDISGFAALLDKPVNKKQGTTMNNIQAVQALCQPLSQVTQLKFSETLRQNLLCFDLQMNVKMLNFD